MSTNLLPVFALEWSQVTHTHMEVPSDYYKGLHVISKGHAPLLILVPPWEMDLNSTIMVTRLIYRNAQFTIQGCP